MSHAMNAPSQRQSRSRTSRRSIVLILAIALFAVAIVIYYSIPSRLTQPTDPPVQVARFVATDEFVALPGELKQAYVDRLERLSFDQRREVAKAANLSPEQAKTAYRNVFRQAAQHRIDTYFSITDSAKREIYLDQLIDEYEKEQTFHKREPPNPAQIKAQLESMPPGQRAQAAEFLHAFVQRRILRGLGLFQ